MVIKRTTHGHEIKQSQKMHSFTEGQIQLCCNWPAIKLLPRLLMIINNWRPPTSSVSKISAEVLFSENNLLRLSYFSYRSSMPLFYLDPFRSLLISYILHLIAISISVSDGYQDGKSHRIPTWSLQNSIGRSSKISTSLSRWSSCYFSGLHYNATIFRVHYFLYLCVFSLSVVSVAGL